MERTTKRQASEFLRRLPFLLPVNAPENGFPKWEVRDSAATKHAPESNFRGVFFYGAE